jgi:hypothetical protein
VIFGKTIHEIFGYFLIKSGDVDLGPESHTSGSRSKSSLR